MSEEKQETVSIRGMDVSKESAENFLAWLDDCPEGLLRRIVTIERDDCQSKALAVGRPRDARSDQIIPWEYRCAEKEQSVGMAIAYENVLNLQSFVRQELGLDKE